MRYKVKLELLAKYREDAIANDLSSIVEDIDRWIKYSDAKNILSGYIMIAEPNVNSILRSEKICEPYKDEIRKDLGIAEEYFYFGSKIEIGTDTSDFLSKPFIIGSGLANGGDTQKCLLVNSAMWDMEVTPNHMGIYTILKFKKVK
jgi:hypothetical protein